MDASGRRAARRRNSDRLHGSRIYRSEHAPCREGAQEGCGMARRKKIDRSPGVAAACGAAAGLIGGLALLTLDRVVAPRVLGDQRERTWDARVANSLASVGFRLSPSGRTAAGLATSLAYAALLGAVYGLARQRLQRTPAARGLLDAALVYGASLISPEPPPRPRSARRYTGRAAAMQRVSSVSIFGKATAAAYRALSRRAG